MKIIPFKRCNVHVYHEIYLETVFDDGKICPAFFIDNEETRKTMHETGYRDINQMHFEHEIAHTFLSQEMGRPWSYVLRRVAIGEPWTFNQERSDEEGIVLAFQRYLNTGESNHWLDIFDDVYDLSRVFNACYREKK